MLKKYKIRLNPTPEQETYFKKGRGIARFTFNFVLGEWKDKPQSRQKENNWGNK